MMVKQMSYTDLFQRYGSPSKDAEIRILYYLRRPEALDTFDRIKHYDSQAAQIIAQCKKLIEYMSEYRQDLAARYNQLATMPSRRRLKLERYINYDNKKFYYIRHFTDYDDGTSVETETETFPGKERRAALARFAALKKQYPGIVAEMDIDKKSWEK